MKQDLRIIKGLETKKRIMDCAKSAFLKYGFKDATIVEITQEAGVPIGLFTYYFKTKSNIVNHVHNDYLDRIRESVMQYDWVRDETPLLTFSIINYIYYDNIIYEEGVSRFFLEVLNADFQISFLDETGKDVYRRYITYYDIETEPGQLELLLTFNNGGKKKLITKYLQKELDIPKSQLIHFIIGCDIDFPGIPEGEKERVKEKIQKRVDEIDCRSISMLN
ncbi:MAG: TetR/AcrR family transcriptional regulator [Eubacteriaceae bacterium]|jgi:AcrR family transcriptional regulator|nr:TetR/AcrR family transcriptional regulator [Eubacteriaceae bacterium]